MLKKCFVIACITPIILSATNDYLKVIEKSRQDYEERCKDLKHIQMQATLVAELSSSSSESKKYGEEKDKLQFYIDSFCKKAGYIGSNYEPGYLENSKEYTKKYLELLEKVHQNTFDFEQAIAKIQEARRVIYRRCLRSPEEWKKAKTIIDNIPQKLGLANTELEKRGWNGDYYGCLMFLMILQNATNAVRVEIINRKP